MDEKKLEQLFNLYMESDLSLKAFSAQYGADADRIRHAARENGWAAKRCHLRQKQRKRTEELTPEIIRLRDRFIAGEGTIGSLATEIGIPQSTARRYCAALDWVKQREKPPIRQHPPIPPETQARIRQLWQTTARSQPDIAREVGYSYNSVRQLIFKNHWKRDVEQTSSLKQEAYFQAHQQQLLLAEKEFIEGEGPLNSVLKKHGIAINAGRAYALLHDWANRKQEWILNHDTRKVTTRKVQPKEMAACRLEFVTGKASLKQLATAHNISYIALQAKSAKEGWHEKRLAYRAELKTRMRAAIAGEPAEPADEPLPADTSDFPKFRSEAEEQAIWAFIRGEEDLESAAIKYNVSANRLHKLSNTYDLKAKRQAYINAFEQCTGEACLKLDIETMLRVRNANNNSAGCMEANSARMKAENSPPAEWIPMMDVLKSIVQLNYMTAQEMMPEARTRFEIYQRRNEIEAEKVAVQRLQVEKAGGEDRIIRVEWEDSVAEAAK